MSVATLTDLRESLAAALAPTASDDPAVIPYLADGYAPPVLVIGWADPWLETAEQGMCRYLARMTVAVVTSYLNPETATPELETMLSRVLRLVEREPWVAGVSVGRPYRADAAGIENYISCVVTITAPTVPNEEG